MLEIYIALSRKYILDYRIIFTFYDYYYGLVENFIHETVQVISYLFRSYINI